jgi:class 3 adenylate cyclase
MTNQMGQNLSWFRQPSVSNHLTTDNEEGTLAALKALRQDLVDPKIAAHNGRIVKLMGDGSEEVARLGSLALRAHGGGRPGSP